MPEWSSAVPCCDGEDLPAEAAAIRSGCRGRWGGRGRRAREGHLDDSRRRTSMPSGAAFRTARRLDRNRRRFAADRNYRPSFDIVREHLNQ
jgi:hypothetical protein